jgi:hypothetical protein
LRRRRRRLRNIHNEKKETTNESLILSMQQQQQLNVFMHQSPSLLLSSLHTMASLKTLSQASR